MAKITIDLTDDEHQRFVQAKMRRKERSLQSLMIRATEQLLAAIAPAATVSAMPGIFEGLNDDEIWLVHQLAGILRDRPQGDVFAVLDTTLQRAAKSYVADHGNTRKRGNANSPHPSRTTPVLQEIVKGRPKAEWLQLASEVLDSQDPDLVDALTSNLKQFGKDARLLREGARADRHAAPGGHDHQGRVESLLANEASLDAEDLAETPPARPARGSRSRMAPMEKRHLPPTGSGGKH